MAAPLPKDAWKETETKKPFVREPWMVEANCIGHPTLKFYPERGGSDYFTETRVICADCPVWRDCLKFALDTSEQDGMWGGLTIAERRLVRRSDGVSKCPKCGLIRVFSQKGQRVCEQCRNIGSRNHKLPG